jgi:hypothetical protein
MNFECVIARSEVPFAELHSNGIFIQLFYLRAEAEREECRGR